MREMIPYIRRFTVRIDALTTKGLRRNYSGFSRIGNIIVRIDALTTKGLRLLDYSQFKQVQYVVRIDALTTKGLRQIGSIQLSLPKLGPNRCPDYEGIATDTRPPSCTA